MVMSMLPRQEGSVGLKGGEMPRFLCASIFFLIFFVLFPKIAIFAEF